MKVKRIVFVNRAPFRNLDLDLSNKRIVSLTGINGSGKTSIISYIVDAMYEMMRCAYENEFAGEKERKMYRISSALFNMRDTTNSMVYILFDYGEHEVHYVDLNGEIDKEAFESLMSHVWGQKDPLEWPIKFDDVQNQLSYGQQYAKKIKINTMEAQEAFSNNIMTYFPSYRYEQPGYLNDVFRMELKYKCMADFSGHVPNPIEVTSSLPEIANWIMDVILDETLYGEQEVLLELQDIISKILGKKHGKKVRLGVGARHLGGARIQIIDAESDKYLYPSIFNISAGESSLVCLFGELIRQADKIKRKISEVEGIVLIDEVDKHLHIVLQKEVLPSLMQMFPRIQFIISTHSTFVNLGIEDETKNEFSVIDLDNGGVECIANKNKVFREAYESIIEEDKNYEKLCVSLREKLDAISKPVVFLEGRTDEMYFKKAYEVFGFGKECHEVLFQWIGHMDAKGNEECTGDTGLSHGLQFVKGRKLDALQIFMFDCDTNRQESDDGSIVVMRMEKFNNLKKIKKGIENALVLDEIELDDFYKKTEKEGDYGNTSTIVELDKMKLCSHICALEESEQKKVLANLKPVIEKIEKRVKARGRV